METGFSYSSQPRPEECERRCEPRFAVRLEVSVGTGDRAAPARLLDLSRGGALAEHRRPPALDTAVTLSCERIDVAARVAWVRGNRFGLAFDRPIRATELFFQLACSRSASDAFRAA